MYSKCLKLQEAHYGENNIKLAAIHNNIGIIYQNQGKLEEALQMYSKMSQY
jgi:tetratricopeptide (TPR) repeat protein